MWQTEFFVILDCFFPFTPQTTQKIKLLKKNNNKKLPGDIIILHMCTLNDNHMMYGYWDIECDRQNILPFWTIFCPFTPLATQKMKILKKWKNYPGEIINLHKCTINDNRMMYGSWDMKCDRQNILPFWTIFCPFTSPHSPKEPTKPKFQKNEKSTCIYYQFTQVYHK